MEIVVGLLVCTFGGGLAFHFGKTMLRDKDQTLSVLRGLGFQQTEDRAHWTLHTQALSVQYHREAQDLIFHFTTSAGQVSPRSAEFERLMTALMTLPSQDFIQYFAIDFKPTSDQLSLVLTIKGELNSSVLGTLEDALQNCIFPVAVLALQPMPDFRRMWLLAALCHDATINEAALRYCWQKLEQGYSPQQNDPKLANIVPAYSYFRGVLAAVCPPALDAYATAFRVTAPFQLIAAKAALPLPFPLLKNVMLDVPDQLDSFRTQLWVHHRDIGKDEQAVKNLIDAAQPIHANMIKKVLQQSPRSLHKTYWLMAYRKPFLTEAALEALAGIRDEDLIPFLVECLRNGRMEDHLVAALARHPNPKAQDALVGCLDCAHLYPRLKNHLNRRRDDLFLNALAEAVLRPETCNEALLHFGDIRDERLLAAMLTALTRPNLAERVLPHLVNRREKQVLPALAAAAMQHDLPLPARRTIASGLKMFTEPLARETLHQLAGGEQQDLVLAALDSLAFIQNIADIEFLKNLRPNVRNSACREAVDRAIARIREAHRHGEAGLLSPVAPVEQGTLTIAEPGGDLSVVKPKHH